jgi:uncharacterized iron-regulated membrane protein
MAWLHTWAGLIVGWLLFAIFVTGTTSYYRADISRWMRPELHLETTIDPGEAADRAVAALKLRAAGARQWYVRLPTKSDGSLGIQWRGNGGTRENVLLDPATGSPVQVRETLGGEFLYRFHYELHMPPLWGRWIVGIATAIMLVAMLSGIVIHRRIFKDFFTFRPRKGGQRAWLDAHNVMGVLALPYHLVIAYSGLVLLSLTLMPWGVVVAYQGDTAGFGRDMGITALSPRPSAGKSADLAPLHPMLEAATKRMGTAPEHLVIDKPGDAHATVTVLMEQPRGIAHRHPQIAFDGITGAVLAKTDLPRPAAQTYFTLSGLHEADFAGPGLRILYVLCGLAGATMIATGLVLWVRARLPAPGLQIPFGLRLVRGLNLGAIVGLPIGIAAYFLANRILPVDLPERSAWEVRAFFAAWLMSASIPAMLRHGLAWRITLGSAAILYLAIPVVDATRVGRTGTVFLAFDAVMLGIGLSFVLSAHLARTKHYGTYARSTTK